MNQALHRSQRGFTLIEIMLTFCILILVIGIGKANFISNKWIKKEAIIIDIGINRLENGKITGDFFIYKNFNLPSFVTSVPGGIGPLTISSLLQNTFNAFIENKII